MKNLNVKDLIIQAMIASLYVAITVMTPELSYMSIQFRMAELFMVLILFNPKFIVGVTVGCFIANLFSPLGLIDIVFGVGATFISGYLMIKTKNHWIALLWPALINGIIVGLELQIVFATPFLLNLIQVAAGEFVVVFVGGKIFYEVIERNQGFKKRIQD